MFVCCPVVWVRERGETLGKWPDRKSNPLSDHNDKKVMCESFQEMWRNVGRNPFKNRLFLVIYNSKKGNPKYTTNLSVYLDEVTLFQMFAIKVEMGQFISKLAYQWYDVGYTYVWHSSSSYSVSFHFLLYKLSIKKCTSLLGHAYEWKGLIRRALVIIHNFVCESECFTFWGATESKNMCLNLCLVRRLGLGELV